jgi:hypothetical protein
LTTSLAALRLGDDREVEGFTMPASSDRTGAAWISPLKLASSRD